MPPPPKMPAHERALAAVAFFAEAGFLAAVLVADLFAGLLATAAFFVAVFAAGLADGLAADFGAALVVSFAVAFLVTPFAAALLLVGFFTAALAAGVFEVALVLVADAVADFFADVFAAMVVCGWVFQSGFFVSHPAIRGRRRVGRGRHCCHVHQCLSAKTVTPNLARIPSTCRSRRLPFSAPTPDEASAQTIVRGSCAGWDGG